MKAKDFAALAAIATLMTTSVGRTQTNVTGNVQAGRAMALAACTGCHLVAPDQPFKPIYQGDLHPPDFKDIADQPNVTADSLIHYLYSLPTIPQDSHMANADLTGEQTRDVVAFILSLRNKR